jgi:hypothetical protein
VEFFVAGVRRLALAATVFVFSLNGCLTWGAMEQLKHPSRTFALPDHAWIDPDGETIAVVMSSSEYHRFDGWWNWDLPCYDLYKTWPCIVRYRNDPTSDVLEIESWERVRWHDDARVGHFVDDAELARVHAFFPDAGDAKPPPRAHPIALEGDRVLLDGGTPRLELEEGPATMTKVVAAVWLPFAVVIDTALAPVYLIALCVVTVFF